MEPTVILPSAEDVTIVAFFEHSQVPAVFCSCSARSRVRETNYVGLGAESARSCHLRPHLEVRIVDVIAAVPVAVAHGDASALQGTGIGEGWRVEALGVIVGLGYPRWPLRRWRLG